MSLTARVKIQHERLALTPTLRELDDVAVRVITRGSTNPGATNFPFFVEYDDRAELEAAFDADETVASYTTVDWTDGQGIYYIEHTPQTKLISTAVAEENGFLVHTETSGNSWVAQLLLPDRDALNSIWEYARENDIAFEITEIYGDEGVEVDKSYGLTDEQLAALRTAYEKGYFAEPRRTSLDGVADEMGISSTAASGRLRRGMRNLIAATVAQGDAK